jgi:hypothetical protein
VLPSSDASQSPDDEKILKYAAELFRQLGITKPEPDTVVWVDRMNSDLVVVQFGEVRLPRNMMGRLTPEDWKPLLAPAIIYGYILSPREPRATITHMILPVGLGEVPLLIALIQIFHVTNRAYAGQLLFTIISLYILYEAIVLIFYLRWSKRGIPYAADRQAAEKFGREVLLAALAKYGEKINATRYPRKRLHLWPTVGQRIERLHRSR